MFGKYVAATLLAISAGAAPAAVFVSGDVNILSLGDVGTGNDNFLKNIVEGSRVLVQESSIGLVGNGVVSFYNNNGFTASLLGASSLITIANLAAIDLLIAPAPDNGYTTDEVAAISAFLAGGGNLLLTGDATPFVVQNAAANDLLTQLGSALTIVPNVLDPGFNTANQKGPSPYLAGTQGFQFAYTSTVSGGTALFGTTTGNQTFLAVDAVAGVPEPASWAMMIGGFGLVGGMARRRTTKVQFKTA